MKTKNALIICNDYQPPFLQVATEYAGYFTDTEYQPYVVFIKGDHNPEIQESFSNMGARSIFLNMTARQTSGLKLRLTRKIKALHDEYHFSFVIAHRFRAIFCAAILKNVPVYGVCHIDGNFKRLSRKLFVRFFNKNLHLIGVSEAIQNDIRNDLPFFPKQKTHFLYNSLNFGEIRSHLLERNHARSELLIDKNSYAFVNVGRLHEDKDQETLIRAFSIALPSLSNAHLYIIGKGRLESKLKKLVTTLGIDDHIHFLGSVQQAYRYLPAFDCFVMSSIREGLPVAILEAYAARLPVVASYCNGNAEAIEGVFRGFQVGDASELAALMLEVHKFDDQQLASMRERIELKINNNFTRCACRNMFWKIISEQNSLNNFCI